MATVTIAIPNTGWSFNTVGIEWNPANSGRIALGSSLSTNGTTDLYLRFLRLPRNQDNTVNMHLSDSDGVFDPGPEFSTQMEMNGTIRFVDSANNTLTLTGISDATEPYVWSPSNIADVAAFAEALIALTDRSLTVTFYDGINSPPTGVPAISDTMPVVGDTLTVDTSGIADADGLGAFNYQWQRGTTNITGQTGDSYTVQTVDIGSTLRVRVSYTDGNSTPEMVFSAHTMAVMAGTFAPVFVDDTGDFQVWDHNVAITPITVPVAMADPDATYAAQGTLPSNIAFDTTTRVISGTPTAIGMGTITIRATNTEGTDDWTVAYSTVAPGGPVVTLEMDFGNDGTFSHAAADVSGDLVSKSLQCYRGRTLQSRRFAVAGQLTCRLWNLTNKYDPFNSNSPLYNADISGIGVRLQFDGATVWSGILDDINYVERPVPHVVISALGRLSTLRQPVSVASQTSTTVGAVAKLVGTAAGITTTHIGGDKSLDRWPGVRTQEALTVLRALEENEEGFLFERKDGLLALAPEDARSSGDSLTSAMTLADLHSVADSVPLLRGSHQDQGFRHIVNVCRVPVETLTESAELELWSLPADTIINSGEAVTILAEHPNAASPTNHRGPASWIAPVAGTDYTAQTGLTITGAQVGDHYQLNLANSSASNITIAADGLKLRGTALVVGDPIIIESRNTTSIGVFGEREYRRPSQLFTEIGPAKEYADGIVSRGNTPHRWLRGFWPAHYDATSARNLELSRRVTVERVGERADYYIEGIGISMMGGDYARMEYLLSPVPGATVPFAPLLTVRQVTNESMQLAVSWTLPFNGGETITGYNVEYRLAPSMTWLTWPHAGLGRTTTVTGLVAGGRNYQFRVNAVNSEGTGPWSTIVSQITPTLAPEAPAAPMFTQGVRRIQVAWVPPDNNGGVITDYDVRYREEGETMWEDWPFAGVGTSTTITGLEVATNYEVEIRASNSEGPGAWSPTATGMSAPWAQEIMSGTATWYSINSDGDRFFPDVGDGVPLANWIEAGGVDVTDALQAARVGWVANQPSSIFADRWITIQVIATVTGSISGGDVTMGYGGLAFVSNGEPGVGPHYTTTLVAGTNTTAEMTLAIPGLTNRSDRVYIYLENSDRIDGTLTLQFILGSPP